MAYSTVVWNELFKEELFKDEIELAHLAKISHCYF